MNRLYCISIIAMLLTIGCASPARPLSTAEKLELQKYLSPKFDMKSVPQDREEDFYRIVAVFATTYIKDFGEQVREIKFRSADEADVFFRDMFMHGGGLAKVQKKNGRWTIVKKGWYA